MIAVAAKEVHERAEEEDGERPILENVRPVLRPEIVGASNTEHDPGGDL